MAPASKWIFSSFRISESWEPPNTMLVYSKVSSAESQSKVPWAYVCSCENQMCPNNWRNLSCQTYFWPNLMRTYSLKSGDVLFCSLSLQFYVCDLLCSNKQVTTIVSRFDAENYTTPLFFLAHSWKMFSTVWPLNRIQYWYGTQTRHRFTRTCGCTGFINLIEWGNYRSEEQVRLVVFIVRPWQAVLINLSCERWPFNGE